MKNDLAGSLKHIAAVYGADMAAWCAPRLIEASTRIAEHEAELNSAEGELFIARRRIADLTEERDERAAGLRTELYAAINRAEKAEALLVEGAGVMGPCAAVHLEALRERPTGYADDRHAWGFNGAYLLWGDFRRAAQWAEEVRKTVK